MIIIMSVIRPPLIIETVFLHLLIGYHYSISLLPGRRISRPDDHQAIWISTSPTRIDDGMEYGFLDASLDDRSRILLRD